MIKEKKARKKEIRQASTVGFVEEPPRQSSDAVVPYLLSGDKAPGPVQINQALLDARLKAFFETDSIAGECVRVLRTKIQLKNLQERPRTILITSPQPGDGKTTLATALAFYMAQGAHGDVVLIDADLRAPSVHKSLGLKPRQGLCEYLQGDKALAPYIVKTSVPGLSFLSAGKPPPNPSEVLSSAKMQQLLQGLKCGNSDRYVIIDAAPAHLVSETPFLASIVDGVVMVVRSGKTEKETLLQAIENVGRDKILGLVFNASSEPSKSYRDYYRYYGKESQK